MLAQHSDMPIGPDTLVCARSTDQAEREFAVKAFKTGKKDVLVATDVASKGLSKSSLARPIPRVLNACTRCGFE